ncbi:CGNR zinc finger domain-containing protein [Streptomyces marincola]|uniref:CGNR zinc finger domain-containing protein n=1 Tax=Streptomyces marincola TaxID=2878388 RepID=UPI001CF5A00C|nr:CGNR zinc finger domain-containing protein [Streptomyces marincola]UCM88306.1 CGNR zinc finger domain-containing protein [Streptomyces marincola]
MEIPLDDYERGAAVATALVCTSPTVREPEGDALPDAEALTAFLERHRLRLDAVPQTRPPSAADLFDVHLLRREVRGVMETATAEEAVAGAGVLAARAARAPVLRRDGKGRWQWYVTTSAGAPLAAELAAFLAIGLFGVVRRLGHRRFRACAAPGCRGVFADTSRAGERRYCMPERCGNRLKVANHRRRQRLGDGVR